MKWLFWRKREEPRQEPEPPPAPTLFDRRWVEDWKVGDIAEVVSTNWSSKLAPWERLPVGARFRVVGFKEDFKKGTRCKAYFLLLEGLENAYTNSTFRKVRPVEQEQPEVVERILKAPGAPDKVREPSA